MRFDEANDYLLSLGHETLAIKLGLRNIKLLLAELGNPHRRFPSVQIAGTNGKGSTAVVLESICRSAGIPTGLYTSPHLVSIVERLRISSREISREQFAEHATEVRTAAENLLSSGQIEALPTFFEQLTAIALLAFKEAAVKLAILETGLGGRLDAVTAVKADIVAITPIAFDHEEYLGQTIDSIAAEKAAIIRPGVTAIIAPQDPEVLDAIRRQCEACGVNPRINQCTSMIEEASAEGRFRVTFETKEDRYDGVLLGLLGRHQITNVSVAIQLAEALRSNGFPIDSSTIVAGIENASHQGRLELHKGSPGFLFDGAHNPSGALALRAYLDEFVAVPITLIFSAMRDKRIDRIGKILFSAAEHLVLTPLDNPRAATIEMLEGVASQLYNPSKISKAGSVAEAIQIARKVTPANGLICASGSLYLVGEALAITHKRDKRNDH